MMLFGLVWVHCLSGAKASPIVHTPSGPIQGSDGPGYAVFKGIPFGEDTSTRRWDSPVPKQPWSPAVFNATSFGHACPGGKPIVPINTTTYSEDCLFVNVWIPTGTTNVSKLPTAVWIHGGGNANYMLEAL